MGEVSMTGEPVKNQVWGQLGVTLRVQQDVNRYLMNARVRRQVRREYWERPMTFPRRVRESHRVDQAKNQLQQQLQEPMTRLFDIDLPKWPAHVVVGDSVTEDQAAEILIRTDNWCLSTNDKAWKRKVAEIAGIQMGKHDWLDWESLESFREKLGVLDLSYLSNSQIASCYIGGPHGWCSWDGTIALNGVNIGKWPSVEEVYNDWVRIAEAFPYLNLRSQLFSGESCEEHSLPVVEFQVSNGKVTVTEPDDPLEAQPRDLEDDMQRIMFDPSRERGISPSKLQEALATVKSRVA